jgi:hypothetical protein
VYSPEVRAIFKGIISNFGESITQQIILIAFSLFAQATVPYATQSSCFPFVCMFVAVIFIMCSLNNMQQWCKFQ